MHIKSVAIEAFLSYEQLQMAEGMQLSPGCNLILGKNGTGKSNFLQGKFSSLFGVCSSLFDFSAVIYALSDKFKSVSKQEKRRMLHEGALAANSDRAQRGARADAHTYLVEVTLDNSKRRIPIEADDLILRKSYHC